MEAPGRMAGQEGLVAVVPAAEVVVWAGLGVPLAVVGVVVWVEVVALVAVVEVLAWAVVVVVEVVVALVLGVPVVAGIEFSSSTFSFFVRDWVASVPFQRQGPLLEDRAKKNVSSRRVVPWPDEGTQSKPLTLILPGISHACVNVQLSMTGCIAAFNHKALPLAVRNDMRGRVNFSNLSHLPHPITVTE